jgi:L-threonylcarbamoyladenylate synthase
MYTKLRWQAQFASHVLRQGGVIAHPTEAVWGLACDPYSEAAVDSLLALKGRPVEKGLILVSSNIDHFENLLEPLGTEMKARFCEPQLRPTTWIVPDERKIIPSWVRGHHKGVAVRVSTHPVIVELSRFFGGAIISTSANPAGKKPAMSVGEIRGYFRGRLDYILPGSLGGALRPSRIIDLATGNVLRD